MRSERGILRAVKASVRDVVRLTRELIREARKTGIETSRDIASSEMFFDEARSRAAAARREVRAKFAEAKAEIERELGSGREEEHDSENVEAVWNTGGTTVRLVLAHEDKEMPFVLTLSAEHGAPLLVDVAAPELCECSTLTTTKDPFVGADLVLVMNNSAIPEVVAESTYARSSWHRVPAPESPAPHETSSSAVRSFELS